MGFSGTYVYDGTEWTRHQPGQLPDVAEPWLMVDVHDSTYTAITYRPTGPGSGVAYLGRAPQGTNEGSDTELEADGLVHWWARTHETTAQPEHESKRQEIADYLSRIDTSTKVQPGDGGQPDPAETFAELKTARFLVALGLPVPTDLVR